MLAAFQSSGLSRQEFASFHRLAVHKIAYWAKLVPIEPAGALGGEVEIPEFVPVNVSPHVPTTQTSAPAKLSLVAPHGWIIEVNSGFDADLLRSIIATLDECGLMIPGGVKYTALHTAM